jgi:hypothetical protein
MRWYLNLFFEACHLILTIIISEDFCRLWYNAMSFGKSQPTFRGNISPCSMFAVCFMLLSCLTHSSALRMEATCSSKTSVDFHLTIHNYIPDNRTLHNCCCENLKLYLIISAPLQRKYAYFRSSVSTSIYTKIQLTLQSPAEDLHDSEKEYDYVKRNCLDSLHSVLRVHSDRWGWDGRDIAHAEFWSENLKGREHLGRPGRRWEGDVKIYLTKYGVRMWTGFTCLGIRSSIELSRESYDSTGGGGNFLASCSESSDSRFSQKGIWGYQCVLQVYRIQSNNSVTENNFWINLNWRNF